MPTQTHRNAAPQGPLESTVNAHRKKYGIALRPHDSSNRPFKRGFWPLPAYCPLPNVPLGPRAGMH